MACRTNPNTGLQQHCLLLTAHCLLLTASAHCRGTTGLGSVVKLAGLHDELLVIILPVAIDVDLDDQLVGLSVRFSGIESQAILASQHPVN